jgi:predicted HTH transcriptional regulator
MNWDDIINLLEQGEGQAVEFEKGVPSADDLARELVAFSNSDGGRIIYGIDDKNKHLIGLSIDPGFADWVIQVGSSRCTPAIHPNVEIVEKNDKRMAVITVSEGDEKPYKTDDICYIRDVNISRPAREDEEEEIKSPWSGKDLNKRQKRALQFINEHGSITNREFREAFGVSHKTAHIELTMMADKRLVIPQGSGRSTCYIVPEKQAAL